jgi:hypothetical protein
MKGFNMILRVPVVCAIPAAVTMGIFAVKGSIPDAKGVYTGCVLPSGQVRIIDTSAATCGDLALVGEKH